MKPKTQDEFNAKINRLANQAAKAMREIGLEVMAQPTLMTVEHKNKTISFLEVVLTGVSGVLTTMVGNQTSPVESFNLETYEPPATATPAPVTSVKPSNPHSFREALPQQRERAPGLPPGAKVYDPNKTPSPATEDDGVGFIDLEG